MKRQLLFFYALFIILLTGTVYSQGIPPLDQQRPKVRGYSGQQEIVNMDSTTRMDQALLALSDMSKKFAGKPIIDLEKRNTPIGLDVVNQQWRDALEMILDQNGLWYKEDREYIIVMTADMARALEGAQSSAIKKPTLESREIMITTTFISFDLTKATSMGIDWSFNYFKNYDTLGGGMISNISKSAMDISYGRGFNNGHGDFTSMLHFYSNNGIADVIASPRISITSGDSGMAQVGRDITVPRRDISGGGNVSVSAQPIPTGTIVRVRPEIIRQDTIDFIWLDLDIERSNVITTGELPVIDRNRTRTKLLLIDGEEAFLSGLYYNENSVSRTGVPFLKDLPPYVLGLRYIFGTEEIVSTKRELAMLIKAEILPSLRDRAMKKGTPSNVLEKIRKGFDQDVDRLIPKHEGDK